MQDAFFSLLGACNCIRLEVLAPTSGLSLTRATKRLPEPVVTMMFRIVGR